MVAVSCPYCLALLAEMRSAIMEADAIIEDSRAWIRLSDLPAANVNEWYRNARHRWLDASADITNHVATHSVNPTYFGQEKLCTHSPKPPFEGGANVEATDVAKRGRSVPRL
jgi:hypothetical protein